MYVGSDQIDRRFHFDFVVRINFRPENVQILSKYQVKKLLSCRALLDLSHNPLEGSGWELLIYNIYVNPVYMNIFTYAGRWQIYDKTWVKWRRNITNADASMRSSLNGLMIMKRMWIICHGLHRLHISNPVEHLWEISEGCVQRAFPPPSSKTQREGISFGNTAFHPLMCRSRGLNKQGALYNWSCGSCLPIT